MPFLTNPGMQTYQQKKWKLLESLDFGTNDGHLIRVPAGFITDLASIPVPLNLFIRKAGFHRQAAVLHDWLYANTGLIRGRILSRLGCDDLFLEAMESSGVGYIKRYSMYWGVRSGGWVAWNKWKSK